jgi:glycosyltransferase involved in cell wall biosynthesis|tara:strand:- start:1240 stop:2112 length:873 start_codon:yes stop_codon:yes gene_type:complete
MKKIIILIPVFNDWESFEKLIVEINENVKELKKIEIECLVINDSSSIKQPKLFKPKFIKSIQILNMKENKGHARCNAFGIRYVIKNKDFDYLILMDSDGEDRPIELKELINKVLEDSNKSVVAKRVKRSEGPFFKFLYSMHKLITLVFTGKKINFGNYSCLIKEDVRKLSTQASLWSSYSGTVKKKIEHFNEIDSERGTRYFGPSKMSFLKLLIHSFSIIAVFKFQVFFRSLIFVLIFSFLDLSLGTNFYLLSILIIIFNTIILIVSLREKQTGLLNSQENLESTEEITH